ncbi:MAG: arylesterase [Methylococcaceae bacterium]|nr:arylesterase [Methylococcaceae bacterium]
MSKIYLSLIITLFSTTLMAKSIVVLGDSISAGYGLEAGKGWVTLLQQKFNQKHNTYKVFNESISGDTTAGGLARIDQALSRHHPELVLIELGANDGLRGLSPKLMKSNLAEMVNRSHKAGAKVLLLSMRIPPNYGKRYVDMFYKVYPELAEEMDIPYVPFILEEVALVNEMMQKDGLHPNAKAQPIIAEKIWSYLVPVLEL